MNFLRLLSHTRPTPTTMPFVSLADLPAEVRNSIYFYVLPRSIDIQLAFIDSSGKDKLRMDTASETAPCDECSAYARTTSALIQTCSKIYTELTPRLYSMSSFVIVELSAAALFVNNLSAKFRPLIKEIAIAHYHGTSKREKDDKVQLQSIVQGLTELRNFEWRGVDRSADFVKKGTIWKPAELRKMITILDFSQKLCKAFYNPCTCPCCTSVRITDKDAVAAVDEYELDVDAEYQDWLECNRGRKASRHRWGF